MSETPLKLTTLANAIARLREGWARYQKNSNDAQIRDGYFGKPEYGG